MKGLLYAFSWNPLNCFPVTWLIKVKTRRKDFYICCFSTQARSISRTILTLPERIKNICFLLCFAGYIIADIYSWGFLKRAVLFFFIFYPRLWLRFTLSQCRTGCLGIGEWGVSLWTTEVRGRYEGPLSSHPASARRGRIKHVAGSFISPAPLSHDKKTLENTHTQAYKKTRAHMRSLSDPLLFLILHNQGNWYLKSV